MLTKMRVEGVRLGKNYESIIENLHDTKDYSSDEEEFVEEEMDEEESFEKFFQRTHYHVRYNEDDEIIGKCMVCKLSITQSQSRMKCPKCHSLAHQLHLLEWIKIKGKCPNCHAKPHEWIKIPGSYPNYQAKPHEGIKIGGLDLNSRPKSHNAPQRMVLRAKPIKYSKKDSSARDTLGRVPYLGKTPKKIENLYLQSILRGIGGLIVIFGGIFLITAVINYWSSLPSIYTYDLSEFTIFSMAIGVFAQIFGIALLKNQGIGGAFASFFGLLYMGMLGFAFFLYALTEMEFFPMTSLFWWLGSVLLLLGGIISILKDEEARFGVFLLALLIIIPVFLILFLIIGILALIV